MKITRLMPTHYLLLSILFMLAFHIILPWETIIPLPWNLTGLQQIVLLSAGLGWMMAAAFRLYRLG